MNVSADCPCGASLSIDDASPGAAAEVLERWNHDHKSHRRTLEEYQSYLWLTHRGKEVEWPDAAGPGWSP